MTKSLSNKWVKCTDSACRIRQCKSNIFHVDHTCNLHKKRAWHVFEFYLHHLFSETTSRHNICINNGFPEVQHFCSSDFFALTTYFVVIWWSKKALREINVCWHCSFCVNSYILILHFFYITININNILGGKRSAGLMSAF